ncbi:MAG: phosphoenolpyruvate carboxylase [Bacteroidota bacterium]
MSFKKALTAFNNKVLNRYKIYNSLFMNLPYEKISNIGMLIPILFQKSREGLTNGINPSDIVATFFDRHTDFKTEEEKVDFLFRVIQYIERQVVLFDSIEDSAFPRLIKYTDEGDFEEFFSIAKARHQEKSLKEKLGDFGVRIVFTAHPTQFYPLSVQNIIHDLRQAISENNLKEINTLLQQLGKTSFLNKEKPTPIDEARNIISYLRNVYFDAIGQLYSGLKNTLEDEDYSNPSLIQLGFWPGGDRDGNPFVTAEITRQVADDLRTELMKSYYNNLKTLRRRFTFREVEVLLSELSDKLYHAMFDKSVKISLDEILSPLEVVREILIKEHNGLFLDMLDAFIDKVHIFKTHFASLDIRQDSRIHIRSVKQICAKYIDDFNPDVAYAQDEMIQMLTNSAISASPSDFEDSLIVDTIRSIQQIREIQEVNGELGCNRYIISNSEDIFAVMNVYGLFRFCGWKDAAIKVDIIPLFETIKGLSGASETMEFLYNHPVYKAHLQRRGNRQTIMLGFSDGTKDGGYLKANWEIFKTKEALSKLSEQYGIKVIFFDGRGGPPARGGGKTHRFYASQGKLIANNAIQLTIQGQTITSLYGTVPQFRHNCEQLVMAGLSSGVFSNLKTDISGEERAVFDELASISYQKYSDLKAHEAFLPYLQKMGTMKYYGRANIGSRPGKRGNKAKLEFSDLRAITFVGSWSQLKQNVPGYFGIGTAIQKLKNEGRLDEVKGLFRNVAFFKTLILNSMMSITKTYFPLTAYMKENAEFGEFWQILYDECQLSREMMLEISGYQELMEEEQISKASIAIREDIVLPLLTIQQFALQKIAENPDNREVYEKMVTRSLFGNVNASRNSA